MKRKFTLTLVPLLAAIALLTPLALTPAAAAPLTVGQVPLVLAQAAPPPTITVPLPIDLGPDVPADVTQWGASTAVMGLVVVGLVGLIRKHAWKALDGPAVIVVSAVVGAIVGAGLQAAHWLTAQPYAGMSVPIGGLLFGVVSALFGSGVLAALKGSTSGVSGAGVPTAAARDRAASGR